MTKELKEMSKLEADVFQLLPFGMDKVINTNDIRRILNIEERHIREIIADLIVEHGIPIGSLRFGERSGYFIATNDEEKNIGTYSLMQSIETIKKRVEKVKAADVETAYLYREMNKGKEFKYDEQLDLLSTVKEVGK